ncbi:hypothetical protein B0H13DRAFT_2303428 [Mycena leptocephala]|nr:hypothetical protein B0H13DRAFT_2303428 [Mycena leptocephala]
MAPKWTSNALGLDVADDAEDVGDEARRSKWKKRTLAELFRGAEKKHATRLTQEEIDAEAELMKGLAEVEAQAEAEEDARLDDGTVEISSEEEYRMKPHFVPTTFYGQLQYIFVVRLPPSDELGLKEEETLILAAVSECQVNAHNTAGMHYYQKEGPLQVVDMTAVQCLVGRIRTTDGRFWATIDRSRSCARPYYDPEE